MNKPVRVLIVEDSEDDIQLMTRVLRRGGYEPSVDRVDTASTMEAALDRQEWDLIIADHSMPHFSGVAALELVKRRRLDVPFLVVSGTISEETAVETLKAGARDYILKGNLGRLSPAVDRELADAQIRRERRRAEEARARLAAIVESSEDAIVSRTLDGTVSSWNASAERLFGYRAEEILGQSINHIIPAPYQNEEQRILERLCQGERIEHFETLRRRRDGRPIDVSMTVSPIRDANGSLLGVATIIRDMTERHQAQAELRASELLAHRRLVELKNLYERVPVGLCLLDDHLRYVTINQELAEMNGHTVEEHLGRTVREVLPQLADELEPLLRKVMTTNTPVINLEIRGRRGRYQTVEGCWLTSYYPAKRTDVGGVSVVVVDITERRRIEEQLRVESAALEAAANAIVITGLTGEIQWVNQAFTRLTGYAASEVVGKTHRLLKSGKHDEVFYRDLWETIVSGRVWHGDMINKRKDGSLYFEEMTITPVRGADGQLTHFIAIKQDVTARKQTEEALSRTNEELQRLLRGRDSIDGTTGPGKGEEVRGPFREKGR